METVEMLYLTTFTFWLFYAYCETADLNFMIQLLYVCMHEWARVNDKKKKNSLKCIGLSYLENGFLDLSKTLDIEKAPWLFLIIDAEMIW